MDTRIATEASGLVPDKPKRRRVIKTDAQWTEVRKAIGVTPPPPPKKGAETKTKPKSKKKKLTMREATELWKQALRRASISECVIRPYEPDWTDKLVTKPEPLPTYTTPDYDITVPYGSGYAEFLKSR